VFSRVFPLIFWFAFFFVLVLRSTLRLMMMSPKVLGMCCSATLLLLLLSITLVQSAPQPKQVDVSKLSYTFGVLTIFPFCVERGAN
jgi:hypothetical protein